MLTVKEEIENLLDEMKAQITTIQDLRDTVFIQTLVRQESFPDLPQSLVRPFARATLMGAWANYEAHQKGYL